MNLRPGLAVGLACSFLAFQGVPARAQWGYPGGYAGAGWVGWGAATPQGDLARGMGVFAEGLGFYNKQTAIADAINADTVIRWNEHMFRAQQERNRRFRERQVRAGEANVRAHDAIQTRLRDNPDPQDIFRGSALNAALEEINNPRVYARALGAAQVKVGGDKIRAIPFQYAAAGITMSIHQLATGALPAPLRTADFDSDRATLEALDQEILRQVDEDKSPDPETVKKFLAAIYATRDKAAQVLPRSGLAATQADRYLKALHGLVAMLKAPALDPHLKDVESRPDATLGELLAFMSAFNLRFGPATTPQQREVYSDLYTKLLALRKQVSPEPPAPPSEPAPLGNEAEEFFSKMSPEDLSKKAPKP